MKIVGLCFSTSAPLVALVSKKGGRLAANTVSKYRGKNTSTEAGGGAGGKMQKGFANTQIPTCT